MTGKSGRQDKAGIVVGGDCRDGTFEAGISLEPAQKQLLRQGKIGVMKFVTEKNAICIPR